MAIRVCPSCGSEYGDGVERCRDCGVALVEPDDEGEEVVYELGEWTQEMRDALSGMLRDLRIAHAWEDTDLVVREEDADRVEEMLDRVEEFDEEADLFDDGLDPDAGGIDEDEPTYAVMADLFVAADRLMHAPSDAGRVAEMDLAAQAVLESAAPFGVPPEDWRRITGLADGIRRDLAAGADDEVVASAARGLRDLLHRYV